jgi:hypothetical protein
MGRRAEPYCTRSKIPQEPACCHSSLSDHIQPQLHAVRLKAAIGEPSALGLSGIDLHSVESASLLDSTDAWWLLGSLDTDGAVCAWPVTHATGCPCAPNLPQERRVCSQIPASTSRSPNTAVCTACCASPDGAWGPLRPMSLSERERSSIVLPKYSCGMRKGRSSDSLGPFHRLGIRYHSTSPELALSGLGSSVTHLSTQVD